MRPELRAFILAAARLAFSVAVLFILLAPCLIPYDGGLP